MKYGILFVLMLTGCSQNRWKQELADQLPLLGHRNWIVVADSAYPLQTSPGVQTVFAKEGQLSSVKQVLEIVDQQTHVRPIIYLDAELSHLSEQNAPGIGEYRKQLNAILNGRETTYLTHESIIAKLDEAGQTFKVLIIKTDLTLPYTSVFFQLDCGYWGATEEAQLRQAIEDSTQ
jgi:D-ribose pyranose/furanose isomerase RbsD